MHSWFCQGYKCLIAPQCPRYWMVLQTLIKIMIVYKATQHLIFIFYKLHFCYWISPRAWRPELPASKTSATRRSSQSLGKQRGLNFNITFLWHWLTKSKTVWHLKKWFFIVKRPSFYIPVVKETFLKTDTRMRTKMFRHNLNPDTWAFHIQVMMTTILINLEDYSPLLIQIKSNK